MKYYRLKRGDYVQSGDEYYHNEDKVWRPVTKDYFGKKYGYSTKEPAKPAVWVMVRRLVPDDFQEPKTRAIQQVDEQWGEEFEVF